MLRLPSIRGLPGPVSPSEGASPQPGRMQKGMLTLGRPVFCTVKRNGGARGTGHVGRVPSGLFLMGPLLRYSSTAWATRAGLSSTSPGGTLTMPRLPSSSAGSSGAARSNGHFPRLAGLG